MLESAWMGYKDNIYECSRGTSKTFTIGSLFAPLRGLLFAGISSVLASASMFRGGKLILKDSERLFRGQLKSQRKGRQWGIASIEHTKPIRRDPDMWSINLSSNSMVFAVPTNNEQAVRGLRANILVIDERNTFDGDIIQKVYMPFLAVGTDFESPALGSTKNQVFNIGTIDYSYRDWHKEIMSAEDTMRVEYEVHKALMAGEWDTYDSLQRQHGERLASASLNFQRYDYTDLLIPTKIKNYEVIYPGARPDKEIVWDYRDKREYIYTYPVEKRQIESKLDEGIIDRESWEAEHRNMFIFAAGSVYSPELVEKSTKAIFSLEEESQRGWDAEAVGGRYVPPVLYESDDPCVLGIDVARTAAYTAFVVIRAGYAPKYLFTTEQDYSLHESAGSSPWANVIWAEQHQHMTTSDTAAKIYELRQRYNIVHTHMTRGIYMDSRGGGVHVRDELANPSPPVDDAGRPHPTWVMPQRIYDPDDKEYKQLIVDEGAWGGLKLLNTTDVMNQELVAFSRAQLEARRLFIGSFKPQFERNDPEMKKTAGYLGVRVLKHQLLRIQAVPTAGGKSVRYTIPGDESLAENQKDMFMAFLYACYGLRDIHQLAIHEVAALAPVAYGTIVRI